jgi:hypothetical protein
MTCIQPGLILFVLSVIECKARNIGELSGLKLIAHKSDADGGILFTNLKGI